MMYHVLPKSVRLARYFAPVAVLAFVPLATPFAGDYFPPPDAKGGWRTLTDPAKIAKTAGIDKQKLDEAFDYVQNTSQHGGLLVVRHGYLVYERYFGRGNREALPELASCGKAFTSVAVGIMLREKASLIPNGLDEKVFTPELSAVRVFPAGRPAKGRNLPRAGALDVGGNPRHKSDVRERRPKDDGESGAGWSYRYHR